MLDVSSKVQLAPGATLAQLLSLTDKLGQVVLLLTVIALASTILSASLVITNDKGVAPATVTTRFCCTGLVIRICGRLVTVTSTLAMLVLFPAMSVVVGPSCVLEAKVIVQLAPIARLAPQVVFCMLRLLPTGMVAATFSAVIGELGSLVTVTSPVEFSANTNVLESTLMMAIGAEVVVTATFAILLLLPLTLILIGPSAVGDVKVIIQLAPIARLAPQVVLWTLMLLPKGIVATTLFAGSGDVALLVIVSKPVFPVTKVKVDGFTVIVAPATAEPRVIFRLFALLG